MILAPEISEKISQKVAKTYSKTESLGVTEIFVKKCSKTSSEAGILKARPPGQLIGGISSGGIEHDFGARNLEKNLSKGGQNLQQNGKFGENGYFR